MNIVKSRLLLLTTVTIFIVSGCGKTVDNIEESEAVMVRFSSQLDVHSRASGAVWAEGDEVGIRMENSEGAVVSGYANQKFAATVNGNLSSSLGQEIYYNLDGADVRFTAYYPYTPSLPSSSFAINISDQSDAAKIDYLHATTEAIYNKKTTSPVALVFTHKMSKMVIKMIADAGITSLSGLTVKIKGMNTEAKFDTRDGAISATATPAEMTARMVKDGEHFEVLVFPEIVAVNTVTVDFQFGESLYTWNFPATTFLSGKQHTWNVTISDAGIIVNAAGVNAWVDNTTSDNIGG